MTMMSIDRDCYLLFDEELISVYYYKSAVLTIRVDFLSEKLVKGKTKAEIHICQSKCVIELTWGAIVEWI